MWGSSASDVYAGGARGTLLHFDGRTWTPVPGAETELVSSLWAVSPTDVLVTGTTLNGLNDVRHYDGQAWSTVASDRRFGFRKVWGAPGGEVFVAGEGGTILRGVPGPR